MTIPKQPAAHTADTRENTYAHQIVTLAMHGDPVPLGLAQAARDKEEEVLRQRDALAEALERTARQHHYIHAIDKRGRAMFEDCDYATCEHARAALASIETKREG